MKSLAKLFGWASVSLAAVTAILYALGFLVVSSHQNLLGVPDTTVPPIEYLKEGGRFLLMNTLMLYWDTPMFVLLVVLLVVALLLPAMADLSNKAANQVVATSRNPNRHSWVKSAGEIILRHKKNLLWVFLIPIILFAVIRFPEFLLTASINNLLLPSRTNVTEAVGSTPEKTDLTKPTSIALEAVISQIKNNDERKLYKRYQGGLFSFMIVFLPTLLIYNFYNRLLTPPTELSTRETYFARFLLTILGCILISEFFLLPISFGKLLVPNDFPVVFMQTADIQSEEQKNSRYFLILRNDREIIVFDPTHPIWESILIVDATHVKTIRIVGTENVFTGK